MDYYWRGDPVAQRIHARPWLAPGWKDAHLDELDATAIISMHMEDPIAAERAIKVRADILAHPGEDVGAMIRSIRTGVRCCVLRRYFRHKHQRLFLEPVLAAAFAEAKLDKLTMEQVPPIIGPVAIHLPDGLIRYDRDNLSGDLRAIYICRDDQYIHRVEKCRHITMMALVHDEQEGLTLPYAHSIYTTESGSLEEGLNGQAVGAQGTGNYEKATYPVSGLVCRLMFSALLYWKSHNADILAGINPRYNEHFQASQKARSRGERRKAQQLLSQTPRGEHEVLGSTLETLRRRAEKEPPRVGQTTEPLGTRGGWKQCLHWRGWFWRNQPYGPGGELRRLVFIGPHTAGSGAPKSGGVRLDA